jgi:hypothetical protein
MEEINLEQEFQLLMRTVIKQINDKMDRGELTANEGEQLTKLVEARMQPPAPVDEWDDPTYSDYTYDQGWSPSSC